MNGERDIPGSDRFETVIIGGGQAGLATGYHLARRGRRFVILDANERIDVYPWYFFDQFIEVTGLKDGYYMLENVADQAGTVEELDDSNNAVSTLIRLCGNRAEIVGIDHRC